VSPPVMEALLSQPENLEEFSFDSLLEDHHGQVTDTNNLMLLSAVQHQFKNLRTLAFRKPALFEEDDINWRRRINWWRINCRWGEAHEFEDSCNHVWAGFLPYVSDTLVDLTLEDYYLVDGDSIDPEIEYPPVGGDGYAGSTSESFRAIVLPVIADLAWPNLRRLILKGIDPRKKETGNLFKVVSDPLEHLQPRVQIEYPCGETISCDACGYNYMFRDSPFSCGVTYGPYLQTS